MPQPKREGRNDAEWSNEDFLASNNLQRLWQQKRTKLTQNQLAKRWGITQAAISRYINGIIRLNPETVLKFSVELDVPPELIDPRISQLMRTKKNTYQHSILVTTPDYEPRIFQGDRIVVDVVTPPAKEKLTAAHNPNTLIIGLYRNNTLIHPITQAIVPIPPGLLVQSITNIIPKETL